ncbi:transglycosylase family protein [Streptomyces sp. NPDC048606]|uniref:transglycosylase family protein n=1 Tax=Streptomyces sp. NPDC048606 TaxID=3154726 RepID=UPI00341A41E2
MTMFAVRALAAALLTAGMALPLSGASPARADTSSSTWDRVAACESGGNWASDTHNGFSGGLQFTATDWKAFGGDRFAARADEAGRGQQIQVARNVLRAQGPRAWPVCGEAAGL